MLKRVLLLIWLMLFVPGIGTAFALPKVDLGTSEAVMAGNKGPNAARIPIYLTNSEKSTDACSGLPVDLALTAIGLNIQYDPGILEFFRAESVLAEKAADANVLNPGVPYVTSANVKIVISGGVVPLPYASTPALIGYVYFNVKEDAVTATPVITNIISVPDQAATPGRPAQTCTADDPGQKSQRINLIAGTGCSLTVLPSDPTAGPLNVDITGGNGLSNVVIDPAGFSWDPLMYNVGNKVILTAEPEIGFRFSQWTGGCTGVVNPYTLVMPAGPVDCTANFEPDVNGQSITVTTHAPVSALYNSSFTVAATASSGLEVAYSSGTPAVCTNAGATFTMVSGSGGCEVRYNQTGDASWLSAPQVVSTVTADKAPPHHNRRQQEQNRGFSQSSPDRNLQRLCER